MSEALPLTPPWVTDNPQSFNELLGENPSAAQFIRDISFISNFFDDLIDGDQVGQAEIYSALWRAFVALPTNPFFRDNQAMLVPIMATGFMNWQAANQMESAGVEEELRVSHVIRYSIGDIFLMTVALVKGQEYASAHARQLRLMYQSETWAHYLSEHTHANQNKI